MDLGEVHIGSLVIKWDQIIQIVVIISVAIVLSTTVRFFMKRYINKSSSYLKVDKTRYNFFKNSLSWIIYLFAVIAIIHSIPALRSVSTTLLAGAGIFAAVIGFASQQAFSNVINGVFVVISRPFRVGDVIRVGTDTSKANDMIGTVEDITLRHTVIRDFQNRRIIIPNSLINSQTIFNESISDERVRRYLHVAISYESNIQKAIKIIQDEVEKHPYFIDARSADEKRMDEPKVPVKVVELQESGMLLRAYIWAPNFDMGWEIFTEMNAKIVTRFREEGIEIPYPHRVVLNKRE